MNEEWKLLCQRGFYYLCSQRKSFSCSKISESGSRWMISTISSFIEDNSSCEPNKTWPHQTERYEHRLIRSTENERHSRIRLTPTKANRNYGLCLPPRNISFLRISNFFFTELIIHLYYVRSLLGTTSKYGLNYRDKHWNGFEMTYRKAS